jgi:hypothetical protein
MSMILYLGRATSEDVARLEEDPEELGPFMFERQAGGAVVDFDKAWHVLHFMLCGDMGRTASPLSVMLGTDEGLKGTEAHFYGYWVITPDEVRAFDGALSALSDEEIAARYDLDAVAQHNLYGADFFADEDGVLTYIMQGVPALRRMARAAAGAGDYIISTID